MFRRREQEELTRKRLTEEGKNISDRYFTIRQYALNLCKQGLLKNEFLKQGKITMLSCIAKKYAIEGNWHYIKPWKQIKSRRATAYPEEVLKIVFKDILQSP